MTKYFPAEIELKVLITNGDGGYGVATIGLGHGELPTVVAVKERLAKFEREELGTLEGYRLATAPEYWDYICTVKTGQTFACPVEWREFSESENGADLSTLSPSEHTALFTRANEPRANSHD